MRWDASQQFSSFLIHRVCPSKDTGGFSRCDSIHIMGLNSCGFLSSVWENNFTGRKTGNWSLFKIFEAHKICCPSKSYKFRFFTSEISFLRMKSLLASWHLSCWISEAFLSSRDIDRFKKLQMQKTKIRCLRNGRTVTVGNMIVRIPEVLEEQYWPLESPDGSQKRRDYRLTFFF